MNRDIKISVIVPVYNVEKYIKQCLESIVNQTYRNLEVIVVNDGTKDNSMEIVEEFLSDKRIKVINKENGGLSSARNRGIEEATGDYISFVDSDDYLKLNMYEILINNLNNEDILVFNYTRVDNRTNNIQKEKYLDTRYLCNLSSNESYLYSELENVCWNKLYKIEYIKKNKFSFLEILYEDAFWKVETIFSTSKIKLIDEALYYYRINRKDSIMELGKNFNKGFYEKQLKSYQLILKKIDNFIKKNKNNLNQNKLIYLIIERESWRAKLEGKVNFIELNRFLEFYLSVQKEINLDEKIILLKKLNKLLKSSDVIEIKNLNYFRIIYWRNRILDLNFIRKRMKLYIKRRIFSILSKE
ncbi:glycosyltransferase [Fusobacterium mortiferum]|uniref:glycosyltransferase n=1 Tax=Fusobacterium mortiferum TaxID=850 RepID=UPI00195B0575|nr:glycosyltransferase [Fusobacterium mortiferum]